MKFMISSLRSSVRCLELAFIFLLLAGGFAACGLLWLPAANDGLLPRAAAVLLAPSRIRTIVGPSLRISSIHLQPPQLRRLLSPAASSALDATEISRQRRMLEEIAKRTFSRESPFEQAQGRPPVLYVAEPRHSNASGADIASVCARGAAFFDGLPHSGCEICDEHAHASRHLHARFFANMAKWVGAGVYVESGALDGENGAQSLFFDEVLLWRGLLIEGNPPNMARTLVRRPHSVRLECALCAADGMDVEFVGDYGGVAGAAAQMGDALRTAFHGERGDRYNVSCCAMRTYWPLTSLGPRIDIWFLDVEGSEADALRSVDWAATTVWLVLVEMNDAAGTSRLDETRRLLAELGFSLVGRLGAMNELWENAFARPAAAGLPPAPGEVCDWGVHPSPEWPPAPPLPAT